MPELRDYQRVAVYHIHQHPRSGIFLDMGLGKTAIVLRSLREEDLPALVVAPKRVATDVWPEEATTWRPDLRLAVAVGSPAVRTAAISKYVDGSADVLVVSKEFLAEVSRERAVVERTNTFVLDELSNYKTHDATRSRAAVRLSKQVNRVIGLTGTPSPNGLLDLWHQLKIIDLGARLGNTIGGYRNRYFLPGRQLASGVVTEWILRPGAEGRIHALIEDVCLSMKADGRIDLPDFHVNRVRVTLPPVAKTAYREIQATLVANLEVIGGEIHTAANAAVLTSKLSQLTAGFMYVDDADLRGGLATPVHHAKLDALADILEVATSPVLVFYRFKWERDQILTRFAKLATSVDEPDAIRRWNAGQVPLLLAHPASAGHGLNLQHGGHTMVWTSPPWSLEEWEQANKRLHRPGQKHPVVAHVLTAPGTVDTAILARLQEKTSVQEALLRYLESPV